MRRILRSAIVVLFFAAVFCVEAREQSRGPKSILLQDPIFGITYDNAKVHYEDMPKTIRGLCPNYDKGRFWLYAYVHRDSADFYVVMGLRPGQDGDALGAAVMVENSKCYVEDSMWMLSGRLPKGEFATKSEDDDLPGLEDPKTCQNGECAYVLQSANEASILRDLTNDAIQRAVKAFGGKVQFKSKACSEAVISGNSDTPVVQQELQRFCNDHP